MKELIRGPLEFIPQKKAHCSMNEPIKSGDRCEVRKAPGLERHRLWRRLAIYLHIERRSDGDVERPRLRVRGAAIERDLAFQPAGGTGLHQEARRSREIDFFDGHRRFPPQDAVTCV